MNELISVIVPVYNVEKYLRKAVQSIQNQSYKNLEIMLINDGSTDSSGDICDELAASDSRIVVIHKKNGGVSTARNEAQKLAKGNYVIYVDSDDYIHEEMIQSLYEQLIAENADVSSCSVMNVYQNSQTPQCSDENLYFVYNQEEFLREYLIGQRVQGTLGNKLIRKEITDQLEFPVGKIYEDAYYHLQLVQVAKKYVVHTKPYYYYYHRNQSLTTNPYHERDLVYLDVYQKFYDLVQQQYPRIINEAFFRLSYAYFYIFDKMILESDFEKINQFKLVRDYLKKNAIQIAKNTIFQKGRRIAALALKINVHLYRQLMLANMEKNKKNHD
ncbi:glycosyltransferase family 2 protein [uncultured Granulicatella sp.]|uniref:glycosyltransferase family 2 protein n=1 Tax=uncultured Granulicatella sp. TaxID=316089 RepID=UPI0028D666C9|nr:glycosyltransferase family 2 protein [uncultured Granulicatella sp.]